MKMIILLSNMDFSCHNKNLLGVGGVILAWKFIVILVNSIINLMTPGFKCAASVGVSVYIIFLWPGKKC